jgi:hypothetical protein
MAEKDCKRDSSQIDDTSLTLRSPETHTALNGQTFPCFTLDKQLLLLHRVPGEDANIFLPLNPHLYLYILRCPKVEGWCSDVCSNVERWGYNDGNRAYSYQWTCGADTWHNLCYRSLLAEQP